MARKRSLNHLVFIRLKCDSINVESTSIYWIMPIPTKHMLDPAYTVVEKLGGKSAVATELGLTPSTLSRWCQHPPAGTGGAIPQKHWRDLIAVARKQRVPLTISDLTIVRG